MEQKNETYKNVVDFEPDFLGKLSEETILKYLVNITYEPIFQILHRGPATIAEITESYNKFTKADKKENTIYKYVNEMMKVGLVKESGVQIYLTQSFTKKLYQLSHLLYIPENEKSSTLQSDIGNLISEILGVYLSRHFNDQFPDPLKLKEFLIYQCGKSYNLIFNFIAKFEDFKTDQAKNEVIKKLSFLSKKSYFSTIQTLKIIIEILEANKDEILNISKIFDKSESKTLRDRNINLAQDVDSKNKIILNPEFKQLLIKTVETENWKKYFENPISRALSKLLIHKAMTVQEIHGQIYQAMLENYEKESSMSEEFGKEKPQSPTEIKSEATIYKHIQELIKTGFLAEYGRIFVPPKSAQILYTRTAKIFIMKYYDLKIFQGNQDFPNEETKMVEIIGKILSIYLGNKNVNYEQLKSSLMNLFQALNKSVENAYSELQHNSVIDETRQLKGNELEVLINCLSLVEFFIHSEELNSEKLISDLKSSCY